MKFTVNQKDLKELIKKLSYFRYKSYNMANHEEVEVFMSDKHVVFREVTSTAKDIAEVVYACELNNVKEIDTEGTGSEVIYIPFDKLKKYVNATEKDSDVTISCWSKEQPHLVEYKTITGTFSLNNNFDAGKFYNHDNTPAKCYQLNKHETTYTVDRSSVNYQNVADLMSYACDENNQRAPLATVKMMLNNDNITYVATDSHVLAKLQQEVDFKEKLAEPIKALIPLKVFSGLGHKEFNDYNKLSYSESEEDNFAHITFAKDNYNYVLVHYDTLLCASYPDIERIIPPNNQTTVSFSKPALKNLISALKKCSIACDNYDIIELTLNNNKNTLTVKFVPKVVAGYPQESFEYVLTDLEDLNLQGRDEYVIYVSNSFLLNTLKAIDFKNTKQCTYTMCFNTESNLTPMVIKNTEVPDCTQVIAPARNQKISINKLIGNR